MKQGLVIGVTGSLGAGKTTVSSMFEKLGCRVLNADLIAHSLMKSGTPVFKKVVKEFGPTILDGGEISRRKLGNLVFKNSQRVKKLNAIIHPKLIQDLKKEIQVFKKKKHVVLEAALLFESGLDRWMDIVILVKANRNASLKRAAKRLKISEQEARERTRRQMPVTQKQKFADIIIDNRGNLTQTKQQVEDIWQKVLLKTRRN